MAQWFTVQLDEIEILDGDDIVTIPRYDTVSVNSYQTLDHYSRILSFKVGTTDDYINGKIADLLENYYSPWDVHGWTYDRKD